MFLFATRPIDTRLTENPLGWYMYRCEVATTPWCVEWAGSENLTFLSVHAICGLAVLVFLLWRAWQSVCLQKSQNRGLAGKVRLVRDTTGNGLRNIFLFLEWHGWTLL